MDTLILIGLIVLFIKHLQLANRVKECERHLKQLSKPACAKPELPPLPAEKELYCEVEEKAPQPLTTIAATQESTSLAASQESSLAATQESISLAATQESTPLPAMNLAIPFVSEEECRREFEESKQTFEKLTLFFGKLKENWVGLFGSLAIVIGAVFFGLTSEIMKRPEARVAILIGISFLFLAISHRIRQQAQWSSLCGWLRSIAATVILFATLGAGGIAGLKFIDNPLYALFFLCFGIGINLFLASTTAVQSVASMHVILSLIAFCIVPQSVILLPLGAIVALIGLITAYRSKWDFHLLLIVLAFAFQNSVWTIALHHKLLPWMHLMAIVCAMMVGCVGAIIHYNQKYKSPQFELLPFVAHLSNWLFLIWNISLHAHYAKWTPFLCGAIAIGGFLLARIAKRKEINWLFHTDTMLSQLVAIYSIATLSMFSIHPLDLALVILLEAMLFNCICFYQKDNFLLRAGYWIQLLVYLAIMIITLEPYALALKGTQFVMIRLALVTGLCWAFHLIGSRKKWIFDDMRFFLFGESEIINTCPITGVCGTIAFLSIYLIGFNFYSVQAIVLLIVGGMAYWRRWRDDFGLNLSFILALIFMHLLNGILLLKMLIPSQMSSTIVSRIDFLGLMGLDVLLLYGNSLQFKTWRINFTHLLVYALGLQMGLCAYVFTKDISLLIPGYLFLALSLLNLEVACRVTRHQVKESLLQVGLAFLITFLIQFVTVHLQIDPVWQGVSLRPFSEAFGALSILYWMAFIPKENGSKWIPYVRDCLLEVFLGFVTLSLFLEIPDAWRPVVWSLGAIALLVGKLRYNWPERLYIYSWLYLIASIIHVAFVTSYLAMEQFYLPVFTTIILQFGYCFIVHQKQPEIEKKSSIPIYRHFPLSILLPIFLGIALMLAFNFEKAILTVLWVGLTGLYLAVGLLIKSKRSIQIAMAALLLCSLRLLIFDLMQSDLAIRALVFIGVGGLMLGISTLYKKYRHRIEAHEGA